MGRRIICDEALERERQLKMFVFEKELVVQGYRVIAGVDEAGRGPLAGPVVAAAVVLPRDIYLPGLNDSKQMRPAARERLYELMLQEKVAFGIGIGTVAEIDALNILGATKLAMQRAVAGLPEQPDFLLIDALTLPELNLPQKGIVHGDALSLSIAAASVFAKVTRDRMMEELDREYPEYGFAKHKGYPTAAHYRALAKYGPSPIHRRSFRLAAEEQLALAWPKDGEAG
ncbi:MAG TPA: ribonuclease HII [Firmicutes bacterium]|jgi:ribonuclease HII|nr:ribonuclease HII [Bacillota bacterium]HOQ23067.1 ribonuclease HII [Bacillota bacterium]HPT66965.1 ribonuclease HII [Bacillota bacterium]